MKGLSHSPDCSPSKSRETLGQTRLWRPRYSFGERPSASWFVRIKPGAAEPDRIIISTPTRPLAGEIDQTLNES